MKNDLIKRQDAIDALGEGAMVNYQAAGHDNGLVKAIDVIKGLHSAQPEICEGCKHLGKWENEVEYGYNSPCTGCKRIASDRYEK